MTTAIEEGLTDALAQRVATVPRGAAERLRSIDYGPRRRLLAVPVAVGAGAAATAATVGTVLAVVLGGATPAYAGWSATPTASSAPSSSAAPDCVSVLSSAPSGPSGPSSTGTWQTLLSDVRGPFTITLLQNGTSYASCFTGPSFTEVNQINSPNGSGGAQSGSLSVRGQSASSGGPAQGGVGSLVRLERTSSGDLSQVLQNHLTTTADGPYTFIDGRVANGVSGVTLVMDDGQDVVATVADGWFVAWWPGSTADASSVQVTKTSGTTSEALVPLSQSGVKFPLGGSSSSGPQVATPPPPGSCTTGTTTPNSTNGPSVNCKSSGSSSSGNSGNSGGLNTGSTGPGPTAKSNP